MVCWGSNVQGQLGRSTTSLGEPVQALVPLGGSAASISAGGQHTCAVLADQALWCWGSNQQLQVSTMALAMVAAPNLLLPAGSAALVSVGMAHTCWIDPVGRLSCMGMNDRGQVGWPQSSSRGPTTVYSQGVRRASASAMDTCVVFTDAGLACWGANERFQCSPDAGPMATPSLNDAIGPVDQVGAAMDSTCVLKGSEVWCFGAQDDGFPLPPFPGQPSRVPNAAGAISIASGATGHCAVIGDGGLTCWGKPHHLQIEAMRIDGGLPGPVAAVAIGVNSVCAVLRSGAVMCWGDNVEFSLGRDAGPGPLTPPDFIDP